VGPNGGSKAFATVLNPLTSFAGSSSLLAQYEQFRIRGIKVYARSDSTNLGGVNPGARFLAAYQLAEFSTIATYIDYDSFSAPTESDFLGRDAMKIRSLRPGQFNLIAAYVPRVRLSDVANNLPALVPQNNSTWISCSFADLDWLGLNLRITQDCPFWGLDAGNCARAQLFIKADVEFRGLKKDVGLQFSAQNSTTADPTILTETSYPSEVLNSSMIQTMEEPETRGM
jgi:hypothetical protein